jgi:hypothetical protein
MIVKRYRPKRVLQNRFYWNRPGSFVKLRLTIFKKKLPVSDIWHLFGLILPVAFFVKRVNDQVKIGKQVVAVPGKCLGIVPESGKK